MPAEVETTLGAMKFRFQSVLACAHFMALKNWLGEYQISEEISRREKGRGLREAHFHLHEMGAIREMVKMMKVSLHVQKGLAGQQ